MRAMTRDAKVVAALAAASLAASVAVLPGLVRRVAALSSAAVAEAAAAAAAAERGPFHYAEVKREPAAVPARFSALPPRVREWRDGWTDARPPAAHVSDLLCAGDADMWRRAREAIAASGAVSAKEVEETYGAAVRFCEQDGCFAAALVARGDPAPVALPAWMVLARCPSREAEALFRGRGVPDAAARARAECVKEGALPSPSAKAGGKSPPGPLFQRLLELGLLPGGVPAARVAGAETAAEILIRAGRAYAFDTETGVYPNEHDSLLRSLAALQPEVLGGAVFEEVAPAVDDEEHPYLLRAYVGGERFEAEARNLGDWWDVEATVGLLNAVAKARGSDGRWWVLSADGQVATVVAGPSPALRAGVAAGVLEGDSADAAMDQGKEFEGQVLERLRREGK
jgi:hypothetical protein